MTDAEILRKALSRYRAETRQNTVFKDDVIIFLEKEIDRYNGIIQRMEYNVDRMVNENQELKRRLNAIYGTQTTGAITEQLKEWKGERPAAEIIKALADNGYKTITLNFYKD